MPSNVEKHLETRILVADDDAVSRLFCRQSLGSTGAWILTADCGETAISIAATHLPDIVLMDAYLQDMSGMEAIASIRSKWPNSAPAPNFIGMTADDSTTTKSAMHAAGCQSLLIKPFSSPVLVNCIFEASQPGSGTRSLAPVPQGHGSMRQLQTQFYGGLAGELAELDLAITGLDWTLAQQLVHRLTGAAALAGLKDFVQGGRAFLRCIPPAGTVSAVADSYICFLNRLAEASPP